MLVTQQELIAVDMALIVSFVTTALSFFKEGLESIPGIRPNDKLHDWWLRVIGWVVSLAMLVGMLLSQHMFDPQQYWYLYLIAPFGLQFIAHNNYRVISGSGFSITGPSSSSAPAGARVVEGTLADTTTPTATPTPTQETDQPAPTPAPKPETGV